MADGPPAGAGRAPAGARPGAGGRGPAPDLGLTTVHLPPEEIGRTAVRLALEHQARGGTPPHVVLGTHLVIRDSVRPRHR